MPQRASGPILLFKYGELRSKEGKVLVKLTERGGGGKVLPPVSHFIFLPPTPEIHAGNPRVFRWIPVCQV